MGAGLSCKSGSCQFSLSDNGKQGKGHLCNGNSDCASQWCADNGGKNDAYSNAKCGCPGRPGYGGKCNRGGGCDQRCNGAGLSCKSGSCQFSLSDNGKQGKGHLCNGNSDCASQWCADNGGKNDAYSNAKCGCPGRPGYGGKCNRGGDCDNSCNGAGLSCKSGSCQFTGSYSGKQGKNELCNNDSDCASEWCVNGGGKNAWKGTALCGCPSSVPGYGGKCNRGGGCSHTGCNGAGLRCTGSGGSCQFSLSQCNWMGGSCKQACNHLCNNDSDCYSVWCVNGGGKNAWNGQGKCGNC